jgi:3-(methylthio)propanoyl-CoA dehydrogenase
MYRAPLKEIRFVLRHLAGDGQLCGLPGLPGYSADLADGVLEEAARFAEEVLEPVNRTGDRSGARWTPAGVEMSPEFIDAYARFVESGWPQLRAPHVHGGQAAPAVLSTAVEELWASANLAFKLCPMLTRGAVEAIEHCGSQEQKRTYLPKMVSGEWTGTMNLTEPQAGSDLGAIRMRAVAEGEHYRLFGQKIFITYGDHDLAANIIHLVLARVAGAPAGTRGISLFIVPKMLVNQDGTLGERNDVRCVSIEHKLGIHGSPTCSLTFGDNSGAVGYLVGQANRGLEYMFVMMNTARLAVGLEGYALSECAYQLALDWALKRTQGRPPGLNLQPGEKPAPIAYHPDVKRMLLTMKSCTDAARAVTLYGALQLDLAEYSLDEHVRSAARARGELLIPIIKGWSTELGVRLTSLGIQIHGGMGYVEETGAAQLFRDARIAPIYEGTTGIQAADLIGRKIARDGGAAMSMLLDDIEVELRDAALDASAVHESKSACLEAVDMLRTATVMVLDLNGRGPELASAVAVPYLTLAGTVIGGWMMARSHFIAVARSVEDSDFYTRKEQLARFYLQHVLPEATGLARIVERGADSVLRADPTIL